MEAGRAGGLDVGGEGGRIQDLLEGAGHLDGLGEGLAVELGLLARRLVAAVDVGVEVEEEEVGVVEDGGLDVRAGGGEGGGEAAGVGLGGDAGHGRVELQVGELPQPQQCREVVAEQEVAVAARPLGVDGHGLDEVGRRALGVLLVEVQVAYAVGVAGEGDEAVAQVGGA